MKKTRRSKGKLTPEWKVEDKYSPPMVVRAVPHTGDTRIIRAPLPKAASPQQRPAA